MTRSFAFQIMLAAIAGVLVAFSAVDALWWVFALSEI